MGSAPQRTCTERPAGILRSASAAAPGSEDCVAATTPREASQTTAILEDLPKSAGEDHPLLGRVHRRTEDAVAAAEGLFASVCARGVERGLES